MMISYFLMSIIDDTGIGTSIDVEVVETCSAANKTLRAKQFAITGFAVRLSRFVRITIKRKLYIERTVNASTVIKNIQNTLPFSCIHQS